MSTLLAILAVFVVAYPLLWLWLWRGRFLPKSYVGVRREDYQRRVLRSTRMILPLWLILALGCLQLFMQMHSLAPEQRSFWRGFILGAQLPLFVFLVVDGLSFAWEQRSGRERQARQGV